LLAFPIVNQSLECARCEASLRRAIRSSCRTRDDGVSEEGDTRRAAAAVDAEAAANSHQLTVAKFVTRYRSVSERQADILKRWRDLLPTQQQGAKKASTSSAAKLQKFLQRMATPKRQQEVLSILGGGFVAVEQEGPGLDVETRPKLVKERRDLVVSIMGHRVCDPVMCEYLRIPHGSATTEIVSMPSWRDTPMLTSVNRC
jgi:hypothetical protein